jgi:hypothetical protein
MEKITVFELAATLVALFFSIFAFNTVLVQVKGQRNDGTVSNLQSNKKSTDYEKMFFEFLLFIVAILIAWRYTHKSKTRAAIAAILFISSILTWISHSLAEYNINASAQRMIAIFLLFVGLGVLSSTRRKKSIAWKKRRGLRRQFSGSVREQVLKHQKYKCANCDMSISSPLIHYDHIDGNHSNNDISNCQALCPNCHILKTDDDRMNQ